MDKLIAVIKREYLERVRSRWFVVMTLLVPFIMAALMLLPALMARKSMTSAKISNVIILDATGGNLGTLLATALSDSTSRASGIPPARVRAVGPKDLAAAESIATADVVRKHATGYLVLDENTLAGRSARYSGRNATSLPDIERLRNAIRQTVLAQRLERVGINPLTIDSLTRSRIALRTERISDQGRGSSGESSLIFAVGVAFLLYMSIVLHGTNVMRGVLEEKTSRVAEVVISSVRPETLLAGKVLGVGAVGLTQQIAWIAISMWLVAQGTPFLARMGGRGAGGAGASADVAARAFQIPDISLAMVAALLLFFVLGFAFYASLYAAAGAMVNSDQEAQQVSAPLIFLLVGSSVFIQPVMLNPGGTAATVMSWLPFSSAIIMPLRMCLTPVSWLEIWGSLAVLAASSAGAIWLAARIYRVGLLMYGKKPTLRELGRWVRQSA